MGVICVPAMTVTVVMDSYCAKTLTNVPKILTDAAVLRRVRITSEGLLAPVTLDTVAVDLPVQVSWD